ncbi:putative DIC1-mitochondrial dicarboxylate carrier [Testicularia cyperi]|uniref:Putative DIC1-mitochondrial dicarboxylate carrier n=1 Tax=Testicularia cyperi TaxID=1882483 RepID=A0A317XF62_9BASI|nr:putative DIC1-mitochondrial dicarboxylate carrier [Testicularia cyperi]PWY97530.1 putative DIC1-mitochondrial dicarboxylate carrier [Testicularia cyperi]
MSTLRIPGTSGANSSTLNAAKGALAGAGAGAAAGSTTSSNKAAPKSYPFWLGGAAGCCAASITHPLDLTKYRLQTATVKQGMFRTIVKSVQAEGVTSLWHGLTATLLRQFTYSVTRFAVYEDTKSRVTARTGKAPTAGELALCSGTAGAVAGVVGNPAEIVLVRMCSDLNLPKESRYGYKNCVDGLVRIVKDDGAATLFRGLSPNVVRSVVMNVSQLGSYDLFKGILQSLNVIPDGPVLQTAASFCAGTLCTTLCTPIDVVKSRVQNLKKGAGGSVSVSNVIRDAIAKDGPTVFFRGWTPAWLRLQPQTTLLFLFFEQFKMLVDKSRESKALGEVRSSS